MKFKVSEDVDAPQSMVWARFTDFSGFEEDARGRGATITRVGNWSTTAEGVEWRGEVTIRGMNRAVAAKVSRLVPQDLCLIESRIGGMDCAYEMAFVPLSADVTRVTLTLDLSAETMTARLLLQTLKLARGRVLQRLQGMIARQGNAAEAAYRRQARA
ncbi:SRPBCC family protein [Roseicyclus persicicus]|uniref:SRPBCC family protein n=1 Tax=Roseicyclus persicicus TaxID=2650661 RepID=A0A7X6GVC1_9RHOB|nr:hypothetical protein [Roseibacterium persicicum]NKX42963.1 hypothetical protein [Roseibacterium persicicum]